MSPVSPPPSVAESQARNLKPLIHGAFYEWARRWTDGRRVLDAGCGEAAGASMLADSADRVVAIDNDPAVLLPLGRQPRPANLELLLMDCQTMAFLPGSFQVVVANAVLEYLRDVPAFLAAVASLLQPDGLLVCGTKNLARSLTTDAGRPLYRNHLQEFTAQTLAEALAPRFVDVRLLGQGLDETAEAYVMNRTALGMEGALVGWHLKHRIPLRLRRTLRRLITGVRPSDLATSNFPISEDQIDRAFYLVAVARPGLRSMPRAGPADRSRGV